MMIKLNKDNVPHKNLKGGIMFGSDGNIRICNFFLPVDVEKSLGSGTMLGAGAEKSVEPVKQRRKLDRFFTVKSEEEKAKRSAEPFAKRRRGWNKVESEEEKAEKAKAEKEKAHEILQDILDFMSIVKRAATDDPLKHQRLYRDINLVFGMLRIEDKTWVKNLSQVHEIGLWIYDSIIFWDITKVINFIFFMDSLSYDNDPEFETSRFLHGYMQTEHVNYWGQKLEGNVSFPELTKLYKYGGGAKYYAKPFQIMRFFRNVVVHHSRSMTEEDACRVFLRLFPDFVGRVYKDLFCTMRDTIVSSSSQGPAKYRNKRFHTIVMEHFFDSDELLLLETTRQLQGTDT